MKKKFIPAIAILTALLTLSCGLFSTVSQAVNGAAGGSGSAVEELWPDVPVMHGLEKTDTSIPLPVRMALNAIISSSTKSEGSMSFMAFSSTSRSVEEIMNYYNPDLMAQSGWNSPDQPGCSKNQNEQTGKDMGAMCIYMKEGSDKKGSALAIIIAEDKAVGKITTFFVRFDNIDFSKTSE